MSYKDLITRTELANSSNYKIDNRGINDITYIVVHFTANDGDSDESNAKYFKSPNRNASAHFFVDDDSITQSVNIKDIAWHCGGTVYSDIKKTGGATLHNICKNSNSIGIELCDTNKNGKYDLSSKTRYNAIKLIRELMNEYNIDINHVVRHFDCTGKYCPRYFCPPYGSNEEWSKFKGEITNINDTSDKKEYTEKDIWDYLISKGLTAEGVAGLMGNLYVESGLKANNLQNNGNNRLGITDEEFVLLLDNDVYSRYTFIHDKYGFGLAQWTYWSRKQSLYDYIKSVGASFGSTKHQLDFLLLELKGYKQLDEILRNTKNIKDASDAVLLIYEKPADQSETVKDKRYTFSKEIYDRCTNTVNKLYRVRKSWNDASSQIGAYSVIDNAKKACKEGYSVYDWNGTIVYSNTKKSNEVIADEVIKGLWGNGQERKDKLINAGYNYDTIQSIVNKKINK